LPKEADIVIVGSGITGTSAARFLAEDGRAKGKSVVMLEAREACWGATGRVSCISLLVRVVAGVISKKSPASSLIGFLPKWCRTADGRSLLRIAAC
jgi:choline dehydrogenase-like flavoprotein